jgi:hypothetical protein
MFAYSFLFIYLYIYVSSDYLLIYIHPSILSALQPWVSLGLLNNQPSLLFVFRLLHPLLYLRYFQVCYNIIHPSQTRSSLSPSINSLPSVIFLDIAPTSILFNPSNAELNPICHLLTLLGDHHIFHVGRIRVKCPSHLIL